MITYDIHALSGAYAVDALDDVERVQFEQHLSACADCRDEVDSLRDAAALLSATTVTASPALLRARVLAEIATVRPLPPLVDHDDVVASPAATVTVLRPRHRYRRPHAARLLAAAAAVAIIGGGGAVARSVMDDRSGPTNVAEQVMTAPDHEVYTNAVSSSPGTSAKATIYRSPKDNEAVLVTKGLPQAPTGYQYVVWLLQKGTSVPAGVVPSRADSTLVLSGDATSASGVGITVEKAGSEPTTPSSNTLTSFTFKDA